MMDTNLSSIHIRNHALETLVFLDLEYHREVSILYSKCLDKAFRVALQKPDDHIL